MILLKHYGRAEDWISGEVKYDIIQRETGQGKYRG